MQNIQINSLSTPLMAITSPFIRDCIMMYRLDDSNLSILKYVKYALIN